MNAAGHLATAQWAHEAAPARYALSAKERREREDGILAEAARIMEERAVYGDRTVLDSPQVVKTLLKLRFGHLPHEEFHVLFMDSQHHLIACEAMFRGTLAQTSVYPREVVKAALAHNAGSVILAHNHPSGRCEPSRADEFLTKALKAALELVDVRVLDHFVVAGPEVYSFAEHGLL